MNQCNTFIHITLTNVMNSWNTLINGSSYQRYSNHSKCCLSQNIVSFIGLFSKRDLQFYRQMSWFHGIHWSMDQCTNITAITRNAAFPWEIVLIHESYILSFKLHWFMNVTLICASMYYRVALDSRIDKITGLFWKRAL